MKSHFNTLLGSKIKVISASNSSLVNLEGIVVYESENKCAIVIITKDKSYKLLSNCLLITEEEELIMTSSRCCKKFKNLKNIFTIY